MWERNAEEKCPDNGLKKHRRLQARNCEEENEKESFMFKQVLSET